jgi:Trk K+ transport system NAD-binding subunit
MDFPSDMRAKLRWHLQAYRLGRLGRFLLLLVGLWMLGAFIIFLAERPGVSAGDRFSSYTDCLWCSTVYLVSGLDEMAPRTVLARVVTVFMMIVPAGVLVMFGTSLVATFTEQIQRSSRIRLCPSGARFRGHIVLCGWSSRGDHILRQIHSSQIREFGTWRTVLIVEADRIEVSDPDVYRDVWGIAADPVLDDVLREEACIADAHSVIVSAAEADAGMAAEAACASRDATSILVALAARASAPAGHIVTEVLSRGNAAHFSRCQSQEQICVRDLGARLIAHAARNHQLTDMFLDLLDVRADSNEVYFCRVPEIHVGRSFRDVQQELADRIHSPMVLVGIRRRREGGVDLVTNPGRDRGARDMILTADDELMIVARTEPRFGRP